MGPERSWGLLLLSAGAVAAVVLAVVVAIRWVPEAGLGGVDPAASALALASLMVSIWFGYRSLVLARRERVLADTEVVELANRLARVVMNAETAARDELLGGDTSAIDLVLVLQRGPGLPADNAAAGTDLSEVVAYYQALHPQRLMITGAGGAGKTVLAIELILGLLETRPADGAVPLRLSASDWEVRFEGFDEWLTAHLRSVYRLPRMSAKALVDARMIVPVVDGLDEMDADSSSAYASRAAAAIRQLNRYQHGRNRSPVIVTCRTDYHSALEVARVWMRNAATLKIEPVTATRAGAFLRSRVIDPARWAGVIAAVTSDPGGPMAVGLSTPWRLTLAATVYDQCHGHDGTYVHRISELIDTAAFGVDALNDHLVARLIPAVCETATDHRYAPSKVHRWLGVLAHNYLSTPAGSGLPPQATVDLTRYRLPLICGTRRLVVVGAVIPWMFITAVAAILALQKPDKSWTSTAQLVGFAWVGFAVLVGIPHAGRALEHFGQSSVRVKVLARLDTLALVLLVAAGMYLYVRREGGIDELVLVSALMLIGSVVTMHSIEVLEEFEERRLSPYSISMVVGRTIATVNGSLIGGLGAGQIIGRQQAIVVGAVFAAMFLCRGVRYMYFIMLVSTRGVWSATPLPWRLARFLRWCHDVRLLRIAGAVYQFRHRELQDYLDRHPIP